MLWNYLRLLDLETIQASNLSSVDFVHVNIGVHLQLVLPDATRTNKQPLTSAKFSAWLWLLEFPHGAVSQVLSPHYLPGVGSSTDPRGGSCLGQTDSFTWIRLPRLPLQSAHILLARTALSRRQSLPPGWNAPDKPVSSAHVPTLHNIGDLERVWESGWPWGGSLPRPHSLAVIVSEAEVKDAFCSKFFQSFVHVFSHGVVVFIGLVPQGKYLKRAHSQSRAAASMLWSAEFWSIASNRA